MLLMRIGFALPVIFLNSNMNKSIELYRPPQAYKACRASTSPCISQKRLPRLFEELSPFSP
jgi:hypothetical protein